jgi:hypothetical protein
MAARGNFRQLHAVGLDVRQIRERRILLAVHEHPGAGQTEELGHQIIAVRQLDHRFEDAAHGACPYLVAQARGIQRAGVGRGVACALDEGCKERVGIRFRVVGDLPTEEAVFRRDVAFDIREAQHAARVLVRQHQRSKPAHGVAD